MIGGRYYNNSQFSDIFKEGVDKRWSDLFKDEYTEDAKYVEEEIEIDDSIVRKPILSGRAFSRQYDEVTDGKAMCSTAHPGWERE
jgi:hypothetical protein